MPAFSVGSWRISRPESVTAALDLRLTDLGRDRRRRIVPWSVEPPVVAHLAVGLLQVHDPRPDLGVDAVGHREGLAETGVEALGDVSRQLQVLALVVTDRDDVGLVEEDVGRHQDRIGEEAGRDELLLGDLLLELGHPAELAVARRRRQQPGRLGVGADTWLCTKTVERSGSSPVANIIAAEVERSLAQLVGLVGDR